MGLTKTAGLSSNRNPAATGPFAALQVPCLGACRHFTFSSTGAIGIGAGYIGIGRCQQKHQYQNITIAAAERIELHESCTLVSLFMLHHFAICTVADTRNRRNTQVFAYLINRAKAAGGGAEANHSLQQPDRDELFSHCFHVFLHFSDFSSSNCGCVASVALPGDPQLDAGALVLLPCSKIYQDIPGFYH